MRSKETEIKEEFLDLLKKKIEKKNGVKICLWKFCYSFMKIKVIIEDEKKINKHQILKTVSEEMNSEIFNNLVTNFKFKNGFVIKNQLYKNKLVYIFEKNRDKNKPHGKIKIIGSDPYFDYGRDYAGSSW